MTHLPFADTVPVVETTTFTSFVDTPMFVALMFALAGAFFIGILLLRRRKK